MAAKFTQGDSIKTTRTITSSRRGGGEPPAKSHTLSSGNTMSGMPGHIDAHQSKSMAMARGGKGFGPHREGPVGERRPSGAGQMGKSKAAGTTIKDYRGASTRKAGTIQDPNAVGSHHIHTASRGGRMPGQKAPPVSHGKIPGGAQAAGIGVPHARQGVERGKMESMRGRARMSSERGGRKSSMMY